MSAEFVFVCILWSTLPIYKVKKLILILLNRHSKILLEVPQTHE